MRFEVAIFDAPCDKLVEKSHNYHHRKRQRGICWYAAETPQANPSLTFRVVKVGNAQLQKASATVIYFLPLALLSLGVFDLVNELANE